MSYKSIIRMKNRYFFLLLLPLLISSCTDKSLIVETVDASRKKSDAHISITELGDYIKMCRDIDMTKASSVNIEPLVSDGDTLAYLVNYGEGWELLSADKRTDPVLIMCKSGSVTLEELYSNPAQAAYMNGVEDNLKLLSTMPEVETKADGRSTPRPPMSFTDENGDWWVYVGRRVISSQTWFQDHLIQTQWGSGDQGSGNQKYNICMPYTNSTRTAHCFPGCGIIAAAQVLHYLHYKLGTPSVTPPDSYCNAYISGNSLILGSTQVSFSTPTDCWDDMPLSITAETPVSDIRKVSSLMLHLGFNANAKYKVNETTSTLSDLWFALDHDYGIGCTKINNYMSYTSLRNQICYNKLPVIAAVSITRTPDVGSAVNEGHAVIIDGFNKLTEVYAYTYRCGAPDSGIYQDQYYTFDNEYIAINWGASGKGQVGSNGDTVWYNTDYTFSFRNGSNLYTINTFNEYLYGFHAQ